MAPHPFPARLLALATLQIIARSTDFTAVRAAPLAALAHLAAAYLELLGTAARAFADFSAHRSVPPFHLSALLNALHGPGALSSLHNWAIANALPQDGPLLPLSSLPLPELAPPAPQAPIARLAFLPLSPSEISALRAPSSPLPDGNPSLPSSASSDDESDSVQQLIPPSSTPPAQTPPPSPWASCPHHRPSHVPAFLPPFPSFLQEPPQPPPPPHHPDLSSSVQPDPLPDPLVPAPNLLPYTSPIPFASSQWLESHGHFHDPPSPQSSPSTHTTPSKKQRLSPSLEGLLQTYNYMLEEMKTNKAAEHKKRLRTNPARLQLIQSLTTPATHDTLFGAIPSTSIRSTRWSPGWIPHPPTKNAHLLPTPELRPYAHTPLPVPVTMSVPNQFPANPLVPQPHPRIPSVIPRLFQTISLNPRGDLFTLVNRTTRLAPPSELGKNGEPLPFRVQDAPLPTNVSELEPGTAQNRPQYLHWSFHWPRRDAQDPLPDPTPPSDFKPPAFPGVPKTTAERARIAQKETEREDTPNHLKRKRQGRAGSSETGGPMEWCK